MLDAVIDLLEDDQLRLDALEAIGKLGSRGAKALPALRARLRGTRRPRAKMEVARAVTEVSGDPQPLLRALRSGLSDLQSTAFSDACAHISHLGPAALPVLPTLTEALSNAPDSYRGGIAFALASMGPAAAPAVPALLRQSIRKPADVRVPARRAVLRIGQAAIPALEKAGRSRSARIRKVAKDLLREIV
jgi:hypothetical protein